MTYDEMVDFIVDERKRIDDAVNAILKRCRGKQMRPDEPLVNLERLKKQGGLLRIEDQD